MTPNFSNEASIFVAELLASWEVISTVNTTSTLQVHILYLYFCLLGIYIRQLSLYTEVPTQIRTHSGGER